MGKRSSTRFRQARVEVLAFVRVQPSSICSSPLEARRAARLDVGKSTSTVRVPWQGTLCVPCQVELRSRHIEAGSAGAPRDNGARLLGRLSFGHFSWPRKKSDQLPGCPRPLLGMEQPTRCPGKTRPDGLLLKRQSSPYTCFTDWVREKSDPGEHVRQKFPHTLDVAASGVQIAGIRKIPGIISGRRGCASYVR